MRGQIATCIEKPGYIGGITRGREYVIVDVVEAHGARYFKILDDDDRGATLLASMFSVADPEALRRLRAAVEAIYFAGHWTAPVRDAERLWTELRDAAGIAPGQTRTRVGARCHTCGRPAGETCPACQAGVPGQE